MNDDTRLARFWSQVRKGNADDCWEWTGYKSDQGYGRVNYKYPIRTTKAHRFSYYLAHGSLPENMSVCHRCDNPSCVNPAHLFLETNAGNMADRERKGRGVTPFSRGSAKGNAVLTESQVLEIKAAIKAGNVSQSELARKYGVAKPTINNIAQGYNWAWLE